MGTLKKRNAFKLKDMTSYLLTLLIFGYGLVMQMTDNLKRSDSKLLVQIAYSIILAVSLNLVVGFLGELSLGHAGFMCIGAYLGGYAAVQMTAIMGKENKFVILLLTMLIGGLLAAFVGLLVGLPALRLKGDYLAIVTLAFGEIIRTIFKNLDTFGGAMGMPTRDIKYDKGKESELYIIAFCVVLVMLYLSNNLIRSRHGRAIIAIRDNEIAAKAMGINVTFYKLFIFVFSAFFAGVAGVLYAHNITPIMAKSFSFNYSIEILVMVVLGGMASVNGSIVAATALTIINALLQKNLSGDMAAYRFLVYALILIILIIFNNAPVFAPIQQKISPRAIFARLRAKRRRPEDIPDEPADWRKVPTKIKMDELLSTDLQQDKSFEPDKPEKGGD